MSLVARIVGIPIIALLLAGCPSASGERCEETVVTLCGMGSHEECDEEDGCHRCTCVPDRPDDLDHGPVMPP